MPNLDAVNSDSDQDEDIERIELDINEIDEVDNEKSKEKDIKVENGNEKAESSKECTTPTRFKCSMCNKSFARNYGLNRHIIKCHGEGCVNPQKGNSVSLSCGQRFYRIKDLKKHLAEKHHYELKTEKLTFKSIAGDNYY